MGRNDDLFSPEGIDEQIEQRRPAHSQPTPGDQLIHDLHMVARSEQQLDSRSLERVWQQVQARREQGAISAQSNENNPQAKWKQPDRKIMDIKGKAMEGNNIPWGMNSSTPLAQVKKRGSLVRTVGMSLIAAVAVITILSFSVFSGILRSASSTLTGVTQQQQQHTISNGKLVCSFNAREGVPPKGVTIWYPPLSWSTQGLIAVANDVNLQAISANNCSLAFSQSSLHNNLSPFWSPDGKKLVVTSGDHNFITYVVDNHGKIIAQDLPVRQVSAWSSDSKNLIFYSESWKHELAVESLNISNANVVTTLAQIPIDIQQALPLRISPNHRFLLVAQVYSATKEDFQIWDINSGKKISTIVPQNNKTGGLYQWTFSPDGSQVAANTTDDKLQIFATASGKLLASFSNNTRGGNTSWSPDGKYIAESTDAIQIFDAHAKKLVATFGKVDDQHEIMGLTWAPDSTGLASVTAPQANNAPPYCTVNVWRLS